jgi:site-specific DNA-methyltransferase (adenine-specific)
MKLGLHLGSYAHLLNDLEDGSVNFWLVDSPYGNTDLGFDKQPVDWQGEFWPLIRRKSAPNAVVACFACESFTLDLSASNREWYRYRRVWVKSKASRYLDADWRPLAAHEDIVVFAPAIRSATYNPQMRAYSGPPKSTKRKETKQSHYKSQRFAAEYEDNGTRYPTTVMEYASVGTTAPHFNPTAKPIALVQELVLTYSNPGDLVVEPFAGDAPAGHACENTGRRYIGCEVNLEQYEWSQAHLARKSPLFLTL